MVIHGHADLEYATVGATHVSSSGHRFQFSRVKKSDPPGGLVGKTIEVKGYRSSREQLAIGCDACPRRHNVKSGYAVFFAPPRALLTGDLRR